MKLKEVITSAYDNLSKSQQKVAKYLLEHPREIAVLSATEIGEQSGVSETTVIRFCYAVGLSGFTELQKSVREQLLLEKSSLQTYVTAKESLADAPHLHARVMKNDSERIQQAIDLINEEDFELMLEKIKEAEKIFIIGSRTSFAAASWLAFTLGLARDHVKLIRSDTDDLLHLLQSMSETSLLISISFHRYVKETIKFTEVAKKQAGYVIGITDSPLSPLQKHADLLFPLIPTGRSTIDSTPVLFSFLNAAVAGTTLKNREGFENRNKEYDLLYRDYFEPY
ncbi:MurR/RpiR family transcriptional regulator [Cytobacillus purgationiresistens]|uniref:DNA-binding MurR/RpiR family transcriptional regulator n=1 Tax=Cytobacillus purgationiresistens TaxID=863449 RepID=A0ABU0AAT2_9BACI|nr:MurR/RpiR family transcriptional regulator [Cytobacillus purgationiresistens]MDQ0268363.1 DNA-binding MurR/RpiR family transcriptional regulator [Cytobacillus purgationiresistens]